MMWKKATQHWPSLKKATPFTKSFNNIINYLIRAIGTNIIDWNNPFMKIKDVKKKESNVKLDLWSSGIVERFIAEQNQFELEKRKILGMSYMFA